MFLLIKQQLMNLRLSLMAINYLYDRSSHFILIFIRIPCLLNLHLISRVNLIYTSIGIQSNDSTIPLILIECK